MRFLVDAQLPRRLALALIARGHDAVHTLDLPDQNRTGDSVIDALADREGRIVISKDSDFSDSHKLRGTPRRLLRVATGNIRNVELLALFEDHLDAIEQGFAHADFVELSRTALVIHTRAES